MFKSKKYKNLGGESDEILFTNSVLDTKEVMANVDFENEKKSHEMPSM